MLLWVDGVGSFYLCGGDRVRVGGPTYGNDAAEIALLANLSRHQATFVREDDDYLIEAHGGAVSVDRRPVSGSALLGRDSRILLGTNVALRFRMPNPLSRSARLDFESHHRPALTVDGIVLLDDSCLLGPGANHHIVCPQAEETVILFRKGTAGTAEIWCKAARGAAINGSWSKSPRPVPPGGIVQSAGLRFRLEALT